MYGLMAQTEKHTQLLNSLKERILLLDGAMGTMIQSYNFTESDYRGERFADWPSDVKGNNDLLSLTQAGTIRAIHLAYLEAGCGTLSKPIRLTQPE